MSNTKTEEYIPFGEEWRKEIKKIPKDYIIDMVIKKSKQIEELRQEVEKWKLDASEQFRLWQLEKEKCDRYKKSLEDTCQELSSVKAKAEKLATAAQELCHYHACEQEGIGSGQPTPEQWFNAVNDLSEAITSFREGNKVSSDYDISKEE